MAKEMQIDPRLLATTMLAISIDNDGRFVGVHLGDGMHLVERWQQSDLLKTVSSPQRGDTAKFNLSDHELPAFLLPALLSLDKTWCQKDHPLIRWNERPERATHFRYLFCAESGSPESENDKHQKF